MGESILHLKLTVILDIGDCQARSGTISPQKHLKTLKDQRRPTSTARKLSAPTWQPHEIPYFRVTYCHLLHLIYLFSPLYLLNTKCMPEDARRSRSRHHAVRSASVNDRPASAEPIEMSSSMQWKMIFAASILGSHPLDTNGGCERS